MSAPAWSITRRLQVPAAFSPASALSAGQVGALAEFVLARWDGAELQLEQVVAAGEEILDGPVHPRMF